MQAGGTCSPARPSGSTPPGPARAPLAGGEKSSGWAARSVSAVAAAGTTAPRLRSDLSQPTHSAFMTCSATFPNGSPTAGIRATTDSPATARPESKRRPGGRTVRASAPCARAAHGPTTRGRPAPRSAASGAPARSRHPGRTTAVREDSEWPLSCLTPALAVGSVGCGMSYRVQIRITPHAAPAPANRIGTSVARRKTSIPAMCSERTTSFRTGSVSRGSPARRMMAPSR
jgi:hypothetical protein